MLPLALTQRFFAAQCLHLAEDIALACALLCRSSAA